MSTKGIAFEQMATLILIILALSVVIIIATTSFRQSASSISDLQSAATTGAETGSESAQQSLTCEYYGYECKETCSGPEFNLACSEGLKCCSN